jgi:hypothetical protein
VEIAQLITTVSNLQIKLVAIEAELIVLRKDKSEREPCHCKCASVTITPTRDMSVTIEAPTPRADLVIMNTEPIVNNNTDVISSSDSECDLANLSQFEIPAKYRKKISKLKKRADHANTPSTIQAVSVSAEVTDNKRPAAKPTHSIAAVITQQTQPVDTKLRAAEHSSNSTKCYIYVGKVHPSSTPDAISAQLIGMGVQCQKGNIESLTRSTNASWKSYKVAIPHDRQDVVLNPTNWPAGLVVRPFRASQGRAKSSRPSTHSNQRRNYHQSFTGGQKRNWYS